MVQAKYRPTEFDMTPDYNNARGIARALREAIIREWQHMHERRRLAAEITGDRYEDQFRYQYAGEVERRLRCLLRIRREGLS